MNLSEFEFFISSYGKEIFCFCCHLTMNHDLAEDLYQEAMLKAFEKIEKINKFQNPKAFLLSIAVGIWKNFKRKNATREAIAPILFFDESGSEPTSGSDIVLETLLSKEEKSVIISSLMRMDEKFRVPLILYYLNQKNHEMIAQICKIPVGTVKSRLHYARKILKNELISGGIDV